MKKVEKDGSENETTGGGDSILYSVEDQIPQAKF